MVFYFNIFSTVKLPPEAEALIPLFGMEDLHYAAYVELIEHCSEDLLKANHNALENLNLTRAQKDYFLSKVAMNGFAEMSEDKKKIYDFFDKEFVYDMPLLPPAAEALIALFRIEDLDYEAYIEFAKHCPEEMQNRLITNHNALKHLNLIKEQKDLFLCTVAVNAFQEILKDKNAENDLFANGCIVFCIIHPRTVKQYYLVQQSQTSKQIYSLVYRYSFLSSTAKYAAQKIIREHALSGTFDNHNILLMEQYNQVLNSGKTSSQKDLKQNPDIFDIPFKTLSASEVEFIIQSLEEKMDEADRKLFSYIFRACPTDELNDLIKQSIRSLQYFKLSELTGNHLESALAQFTAYEMQPREHFVTKEPFDETMLSHLVQKYECLTKQSKEPFRNACQKFFRTQSFINACQNKAMLIRIQQLNDVANISEKMKELLESWALLILRPHKQTISRYWIKKIKPDAKGASINFFNMADLNEDLLKAIVSKISEYLNEHTDFDFNSFFIRNPESVFNIFKQLTAKLPEPAINASLIPNTSVRLRLLSKKMQEQQNQKLISYKFAQLFEYLRSLEKKYENLRTRIHKIMQQYASITVTDAFLRTASIVFDEFEEMKSTNLENKELLLECMYLALKALFEGQSDTRNIDALANFIEASEPKSFSPKKQKPSKTSSKKRVPKLSDESDSKDVSQLDESDMKQVIRTPEDVAMFCALIKDHPALYYDTEEEESSSSKWTTVTSKKSKDGQDQSSEHAQHEARKIANSVKKRIDCFALYYDTEEEESSSNKWTTVTSKKSKDGQDQSSEHAQHKARKIANSVTKRMLDGRFRLKLNSALAYAALCTADLLVSNNTVKQEDIKEKARYTPCNEKRGTFAGILASASEQAAAKYLCQHGKEWESICPANPMLANAISKEFWKQKPVAKRNLITQHKYISFLTDSGEMVESEKKPCTADVYLYPATRIGDSIVYRRIVGESEKRIEVACGNEWITCVYFNPHYIDNENKAFVNILGFEQDSETVFIFINNSTLGRNSSGDFPIFLAMAKHWIQNLEARIAKVEIAIGTQHFVRLLMYCMQDTLTGKQRLIPSKSTTREEAIAEINRLIQQSSEAKAPQPMKGI